MFYIWAQNSGWDALARPGTAGFTSLELSLKTTGTRKTASMYLQCIQIGILNYSSCLPSGLPSLSVFKPVLNAFSPPWKNCKLAQLFLRLTEKPQATGFGIAIENSYRCNGAFSLAFSYAETTASKSEYRGA